MAKPHGTVTAFAIIFGLMLMKAAAYDMTSGVGAPLPAIAINFGLTLIEESAGNSDYQL